MSLLFLAAAPACDIDFSGEIEDTDGADGGADGGTDGAPPSGEPDPDGGVDETGGDDSGASDGPGEPEPWPPVELPEPADDVQPMSCEWLASNNCWRALVHSARECGPAEVGAPADEGAACDHPDGTRTEYSSGIDRPEPDQSTIFVRNVRTLDEEGEPCMTARVEGLGHTSVTVGDQTVQFINDSVLTYSVVCPDGTRYSSGAEGTCEDFGLQWLSSEAPGMVLMADGDDGMAELRATGVDDSPMVLSACQL